MVQGYRIVMWHVITHVTCYHPVVMWLGRMTGVGGRPEVIIEGSDYLEKGWKEYEFLYKPGNVSRRPPIVGAYCAGFVK